MANLTASNTTNITKEMDSSTQDETQQAYRVVYLIFNITINTIACPFTIGLNTLVIVAIKRRPSLQSNANIMLACLAVTDVLTGLTSQPLFIIWNLSQLVGTEETFAGFFIFLCFSFPGCLFPRVCISWQLFARDCLRSNFRIATPKF